MNTAIVGCGLIAELHAKSLRTIGQSINWVIGRNIDNAKVFAEKWDIKNFGISLTDSVLDSVGSVHICTPPTAHFDLVKRCLLKGKHVICEKPLCLTKEESKELKGLARQKNVVNAVNFNVRYYDACEKARTVICQKDFGRPLLIQCSYQQEFHALPEAYSWRYRPEISGHLRATTEIGSHAIDLIRYWTNLTVTEVSAHFGCFNPIRHLIDGVMYKEQAGSSESVHVSSEDAAIISMRFSNGAIGNIVLSEVSHGRNNNLKLEVVGDNQSVWWESEMPYHLNTARKGLGITSSLNAFSQNFSDTITQFIEHVYIDIHSESREGNYPNFNDGFINSLICDAINKSASNNASWVHIEEYK